MDVFLLLFKIWTFLATASLSVIWGDLLNLVWNTGQVCYEGIGCFENDSRSTCDQLAVLPNGPERIRARFDLYTPDYENGTSARLIDYFRLINFTSMMIDPQEQRPRRPLFVVIHGFSQLYPFGKFLRPLKDALIEKGNNVLLIDWIAGVVYPNYYQGASNARIIGIMLANVLAFLDERGFVSVNSTTLIGYSLGAHVAGFAGKALLGASKPIKSIVGLDPSNWLFSKAPADCRLDSSDARFVQIIHTNGGPKGGKEYGSLEPLGHADFFVNGGRVQKACTEASDRNKCSHDSSYVYYIESIRASGKDECEFRAFPCQSELEWNRGQCMSCPSDGQCPIMGYEAAASARGSFYVDTLAENKTHQRFCGWHYVFSLTAEVGVQGEIVMLMQNATETSHGTDVVLLQREDETIEPSATITRVLVFPHPIDQKTHRLSLVYRKYGSWLWRDGPDSWMLEKMLVTSSGQGSKNPKTVQILERQLISDRKPVILDLSGL